MRNARACVVHVAGMEDEEALETLVRITEPIAARGVSQVLVGLDAGRGETLTWPVALAAELRRLRCAGLSFLGRVRALEEELASIRRERVSYVVHLHGVGPCMLAARALHGSWLQSRILCSPHFTRQGARWGAALLSRLLQARLGAFNFAPLATSPTEAQALSKLLNRSAEVLPYPVGEVFFGAERLEESPPRILAAGRGERATHLVTRLCVLLNGRAARVPFSWLGRPSEGARLELEAASVRVLDPADDLEKAQSLSRASAFLHVSAGEEFPLTLAQAMAAGVPTLVSDTAPHRALVRHGETGFVCTSERDFVEKLVLLLRERSERCRLGENARAEAQRRFTAGHFEGALLRAYGLSAQGLDAPRAAKAFQYGYGG